MKLSKDVNKSIWLICGNECLMKILEKSRQESEIVLFEGNGLGQDEGKECLMAIYIKI